MQLQLKCVSLKRRTNFCLKLALSVVLLVCSNKAVTDDPSLGQGPSDNEEEHAEDVDDDIGDNADFLKAENHMKLNRAWQWERHAFMKPLQLLSEMSDFPNVHVVQHLCLSCGFKCLC